MRFQWLPTAMVLTAVLALPARAQHESVHWHDDLESAKIVAKETGRLVLVHYWTPSCGPCLALERNVFNQPGVAGAVEAKYVPVKLNADENKATATWYGVNRVPMDVVITPDGQLVGKMVSPDTAVSYVSELTTIAGKYASASGRSFDAASAAAPAQPQINAAYAGLQIGPSAPVMATNANTVKPAAPANIPFASASVPATNATWPPTAATPAAPQTVMNPMATNTGYGAAPPITPIGQQPVAAPAPAAAPASVPAQYPNPYLTGTSLPTAAAQPATPPLAPALPALPAAQSAPTAPQIGVPAMLGAGNVGASAAAGIAVPTGAPDPTKLPAGSPPLGFDGYCPVSMRNTWQWVPGNPQWGIVHRGRTYWFASADQQKQFWTDPDRYTPALSGLDPVLAIDHKQQIPGKREHSLDYDGLFYMFASEATLQQFSANPQRYAAGVRQAMGIPRGRLVR